jgi:hypothetical protein
MMLNLFKDCVGLCFMVALEFERVGKGGSKCALPVEVVETTGG